MAGIAGRLLHGVPEPGRGGTKRCQHSALLNQDPPGTSAANNIQVGMASAVFLAP